MKAQSGHRPYQSVYDLPDRATPEPVLIRKPENGKIALPEYRLRVAHLSAQRK